MRRILAGAPGVDLDEAVPFAGEVAYDETAGRFRGGNGASWYKMLADADVVALDDYVFVSGNTVLTTEQLNKTVICLSSGADYSVKVPAIVGDPRAVVFDVADDCTCAVTIVGADGSGVTVNGEPNIKLWAGEKVWLAQRAPGDYKRMAWVPNPMRIGLTIPATTLISDNAWHALPVTLLTGGSRRMTYDPAFWVQNGHVRFKRTMSVLATINPWVSGVTGAGELDYGLSLGSSSSGTAPGFDAFQRKYLNVMSHNRPGPFTLDVRAGTDLYMVPMYRLPSPSPATGTISIGTLSTVITLTESPL